VRFIPSSTLTIRAFCVDLYQKPRGWPKIVDEIIEEYRVDQGRSGLHNPRAGNCRAEQAACRRLRWCEMKRDLSCLVGPKIFLFFMIGFQEYGTNEIFLFVMVTVSQDAPKLCQERIVLLMMVSTMQSGSETRPK
jgi:hypothetical protein